jgi:hypothetical protein
VKPTALEFLHFLERGLLARTARPDCGLEARVPISKEDDHDDFPPLLRS